MKNAILVTVLASTLGLGAAVHANDTSVEGGQGYAKHEGKHGGKHAGKRGGRHGGGMMMGRMVKQLGLTEDQQSQLKAFQEAQRPQREALRAEMKALRTEMQALDTDSADYDIQVAAFAEIKANLKRKQLIQSTAARTQFESILTEEQRTKLAEMQNNRQERGGKRGGKRGGMHNAE